MKGVVMTLYAALNKYLYWIHIPKINAADVVEILIIAFVIYSILAWIKNTRAWALLRGIIVILIFLVLVAAFQLNVIIWLASKLANVAVIALVIIFQPELRSALETLGKRNFLGRFFSFDLGRNGASRFSDETIEELIKASYAMGSVKTGALMVLERKEHLNDYAHTGISLDAEISSQLLINIFEHNTPLHDGAVIVREDRLVAATCYLPLSDNRELSKELGTRHRAAIGISEVTDSLTIVVSEETGEVSIAMEGTLYRNVDEEFLRNKLRFAGKLSGYGDSFFKELNTKLKRRMRHAKEAD